MLHFKLLYDSFSVHKARCTLLEDWLLIGDHNPIRLALESHDTKVIERVTFVLLVLSEDSSTDVFLPRLLSM